MPVKRCRICIVELLPDGTCRYKATHPAHPVRAAARDKVVKTKRESLITYKESLAGVKRAIPGYDGLAENRRIYQRMWPGRPAKPR